MVEHVLTFKFKTFTTATNMLDIWDISSKFLNKLISYSNGNCKTKNKNLGELIDHVKRIEWRLAVYSFAGICSPCGFNKSQSNSLPVQTSSRLTQLNNNGIMDEILCFLNHDRIFDVRTSIKSMESMGCMYEKATRYLTEFRVTLCHVLWYP